MKKIIAIITIILLPLIIFYFLNFDFKGGFSDAYNSFCKKALKEEKIPQSWLDRYQIEIESEEDLKNDIGRQDNCTQKKIGLVAGGACAAAKCDAAVRIQMGGRAVRSRPRQDRPAEPRFRRQHGLLIKG